MGHQRGWDLVTPLFHGQYASACWLFMDGLKARQQMKVDEENFHLRSRTSHSNGQTVVPCLLFFLHIKKVIKSKSNFLEKCMCGCETGRGVDGEN